MFCRNQQVSSSARRKAPASRRVWSIASAWPWLLFPVYPLALLVPAGLGVEGRFEMVFPAVVVGGLCGYLFLVLGRWHTVGGRVNRRIGRLRFVALATPAVVALVSLLAERYSLLSMAHFLAFFSVPLWFATARRELVARHLAWLLGGLWLIHSLHLVLEIARGLPPLGLAGERGLMVALSLALAPWAWVAASRWQERDERISAFVLGHALRLAVILVSACALWFGQSRLGWWLLGLYLVWFLVFRIFSSHIRVLAVTILVFGSLALVGQNPQWLRGLDEDGGRLHTWRSSLAMVGDNILFGVGAGGFRRAFPRYRLPEQTAAQAAPPTTEHPDNELLHLAASLGLPLALLWSLLLIPLIFPPGFGGGLWAAHFSAFVLVGHGMFNQALFRSPTALLALLCLGLLWRPHVHARVSLPAWRQGLEGFRGLHPAQLMAAAGLLILAVFLGCRETTFQWRMRRAEMAAAAGDFTAAYQGYLRAEAVGLGQVEPLFLAGKTALGPLARPEEAKKLLVLAAQREPDYGHLNAHLGLAFMRLGREREALPFLRREAEFFRYQPEAQDHLLNCKLMVGEYAGIPEVVERAGVARRRVLQHHRSQPETQMLGEQWMRAVQREERCAALALAEQLTAPVVSGGHLPNMEWTAEAVGLNRDFFGLSFKSPDADYWRWLIDDDRTKNADLDQGLSRALRQIEELRADGAEAGLLLGETGRPLAILAERSETVRVIPLDREIQEQLTKDDRGAIVSDQWRRVVEALGWEGQALQVVVPVTPWDAAERHRALAMVLRGHELPVSMPPPLPPAWREDRWRTVLLSELRADEEVAVAVMVWRPGVNKLQTRPVKDGSQEQAAP